MKTKISSPSFCKDTLDYIGDVGIKSKPNPLGGARLALQIGTCLRLSLHSMTIY